MQFIIKSTRRVFWYQILILYTVTILLVISVPSVQANSLDDSQKYQRVIAMYDGYRKQFPSVDDIPSEDAQLLIFHENVVFVDVRKEKEQKVSMIPGAITKEQFLKDITTYQDKKIIAYCTISYRSGKFAEKMGEKGIDILNLRAGLLGWVHSEGPLVQENQPVKKLQVYGKKWDLAPTAFETTY